MTTPIAIIGAGPAGLFAAEYLSSQGHRVELFDRMPTPGRKFLMAGRGGLNLTHAEPLETFLPRYREARDWLESSIRDFTPAQLIDWADGLDAQTFRGSSGRIFPKAMKASPLLRAWRARLEAQGVIVRQRWEWRGWDADDALLFETRDGPRRVEARGVLLALGGASWPRLGADGGWSSLLAEQGVDIAPLQASNAGVEIAWSEVTKEKFAGAPLKTIALSCGGERVAGEAVIARYGLEGGAVYALSEPIRRALEAGPARLDLDLRPNQDLAALTAKLSKVRKGESLANRLRKAGLAPQAVSILRDAVGDPPRHAEALADLIKAVPLKITAQRGLDRAISTAGGVRREAVDDAFMLKAKPGVFIAGEMLDWDAPTGGYLLQACFSTGLAAAKGLEAWLSARAR